MLFFVSSIFIGSGPSTFSFRITEERQLMGFTESSTYNTLCPQPESDVQLYGDAARSGDCEGLTPWPVIWEPRFTVARDGQNFREDL